MSILTSERLLANSEKIMRRWEERAKSEIRAATHKDSLVLRNALPEQLKHLADALSTTIDRTAIRVRRDLDEATRLGKLHGFDRAGMASYTIDQLIFEFHILRQVICEVMEEEVALSNIEREIINDIVFQLKLLSSNASVEAARAGKQVVTEKVGKYCEVRNPP